MTSANTDREKLDELRETCRLLEIDITELTSEIIELELSRDTLIKELKGARKVLYKAFAKLQQNLNDSDPDKNAVC